MDQQENNMNKHQKLVDAILKLSKYGEVKTCKVIKENIVTICVTKGFSENSKNTFAFLEECTLLFPNHTNLETCITQDDFALVVLSSGNDVKPEDLITDKAIEIVFENTNFGGQHPRDVIAENLKQVSEGYSIGSTANACLYELGLIYSGPSSGTTHLGRKYLEIL